MPVSRQAILQSLSEPASRRGVIPASWRKYGTETAGKMIYAVSRPDKPLPDFYARAHDVLKDILKSAKS